MYDFFVLWKDLYNCFIHKLPIVSFFYLLCKFLQLLQSLKQLSGTQSFSCHFLLVSNSFPHFAPVYPVYVSKFPHVVRVSYREPDLRSRSRGLSPEEPQLESLFTKLFRGPLRICTSVKSSWSNLVLFITGPLEPKIHH